MRIRPAFCKMGAAKALSRQEANTFIAEYLAGL